MAKQWNLDQRIKRLEERLKALEPAEPIGVHIQAMDGSISPPLSADELAGRKTCVVARVIDGRDPNRKHKKV